MISIVFPTLNEEQYIGESLQSLKSKMTIPHELIVSDGKSTDKTVEIAKKYADKVVEYKGETRQHISQGRNAGGNAATGEFVVFMDADVRIPDPDKLFAHALKRFEDNPKLVALTAHLKVYPGSETIGDRIVFGLLNWILYIRNNILHLGESTGEFQMMRKSAFDKVHGFREDLITREDADMFFRLSRIGRTAMDPKITIYHSGRRAHKVGWLRLLYTWTSNLIWVNLFDKAKEKEWTVVR